MTNFNSNDVETWMKETWREFASTTIKENGERAKFQVNLEGTFKITLGDRVFYEGKDVEVAIWVFCDPGYRLVREGVFYEKCLINQKIKGGAIHTSGKGHTYHIIKGYDTVGDTPANFADDREFFNILTSPNLTERNKGKIQRNKEIFRHLEMNKVVLDTTGQELDALGMVEFEDQEVSVVFISNEHVQVLRRCYLKEGIVRFSTNANAEYALLYMGDEKNVGKAIKTFNNSGSKHKIVSYKEINR